MPKYTLELPDRLDQVLSELAEKENVPKAQILRRSLTLLKLAEDNKDDGYALQFTKDGKPAKELLF